MGAALRVRVLAVKDDADDMVHLAHADDERADEVEAVLFAAPSRHLVLRDGVGAADFGDRAEEEVCAVRQPVDPFELVDGGDALECVVACLQDCVVWHVFREVKLGSRDLGEGGFNDLPQHFSDGRGTVKGAVEVPAA